VERLFRTTQERFDRIDVAVNNAGVGEDITPFHEQTDEQYDRIMDVNVRGLWRCMQHEIRAMSRAGRGSIVNISSVAGLAGMPGAAVYVASKHAVVGLTRTAALEFAKQGVRVNAVAPAAIETDMFTKFAHDPDFRRQIEAAHPVGRIGTADEAAAAIVWLASDASSFVTGAVLNVDGGYLAT
jgi:NAD(P)-dependent dehydrogenase (short-subunit alcohol dehydrogenase family)